MFSKAFQGIWPIVDGKQSVAFQRQASELIVFLEKNGHFPSEVFLKSHLQTSFGERYNIYNFSYLSLYYIINFVFFIFKIC